MIFSPVANLSTQGKSSSFIGFSGFTADASSYSGTTSLEPGFYVITTHLEATTNRGFSSLTFNGVSATFLTDQNCTSGPYIRVGMYYINTTQLTTDIVLTYSGTVARGGFGIWKLNGIQNSVPASYNGAGGCASVTTLNNTVSGGFVGGDIGIIAQTNATQNTNISWTNATERYEENVEALTLFGGADFIPPNGNNYTVTSDFSSTGAVNLIAIWN